MPIADMPASMPLPFRGTPKPGQALAETMIPCMEKNACRGSKMGCPGPGVPGAGKS
jgi:hypothetical protein